MSEAYDSEMDSSRLKYYSEHDSGFNYCFDLIDVGFNPNTINQARQNQPEMVVRDLKNAFGLSRSGVQYVRWVLLMRGINKWMYARRKFIDLKHIVKRRMKLNDYPSKEYYIYQELNEKMQHIAKTPRWVEWPTRVHNDLKNAHSNVVTKRRVDREY